MYSDLKHYLTETDEFVITVEIVPTRGAVRKDVGEIMDFARRAAEWGKIHALSLTDNPGGNPRLSPDALGLDIRYRGMDVIIHLACKDYNRNGIESRAYQLSRLGLENILALTGDYPVEGYRGLPKPTFDIDSVGLLRMLREMNEGLRAPRLKHGPLQTIEQTDFFVGAVVSPFKRIEAEVMNQYFKLHKKINNGAQFIITQVGFDARKFDELLRYMRHSGLRVPVLGNVYVLTYPVACLMNRGELPGCVVTDELLARLAREREAPDKGRASRLERAAKMVAIFKGLGYRGTHIGGHALKFEHVVEIVERAAELAPRWPEFVHELRFGQPGEFYYFLPHPQTGLNTDETIPALLDSRPSAPLNYRAMRALHDLVFKAGAPGSGFRLCHYLAAKIDRMPSLREQFYWLEKTIKDLTNDCKECGDCALPEMAYLCPESQCPKYLRNGQCGGSWRGMCEVDYKTPCIWVRVYNRLKSHGAEREIQSNPVVTRDWALDKTSSWLNYFLGRDHNKAEAQ